MPRTSKPTLCKNLTILNIGLDRQLVSRDGSTESQRRHIAYAQGLPARIIHIVKTTAGESSQSLTLADGQVEVLPLPVRHWSLFVPAAISAGRRVLAAHHADVIQVQEPFLCGIPGLHLSRRFRIPLVAGAFGDQVDNPVWLGEHPVNRVANLVGRIVYRRSAAIRADSREVTERLRATGYPQACFVPFLVPEAERLGEPSPEAAVLRRQLLGRRLGPLLLTVSRLEREKNLPMVLEAFRRASLTMPDLVLAVVGDGSMRSGLEASSRAFPPGSVRWVGWVRNEGIAAYYQAADLFLLGSNREGRARVLTEALLAGTPVLTTDTAGSREVVQEGYSGRIVPIRDLETFAKVLEELSSDPDSLRLMGRRGQKEMSGLVSADTVLASLRDLYMTLPGRS